MTSILISTIVPAYNAAATLQRCLDSIFSQIANDIEVIVVDDGSIDETGAIMTRYPVERLTVEKNAGPSVARNRGAQQARGHWLFFIDSDVMLAPGAFSRARTMIESPEVDAVIGSYDDRPAAPTLVSQFKNLTHHYFHQNSGLEATTLFGACCLIKRELFVAAGGFDENLRAIEDVELGYRLFSRGARIRLDPGLLVTHLKQWTLLELLRTDVLIRAIPWTGLWLKYGRLPSGLNFSSSQRLAALIAAAIATVPFMALMLPSALLALPILVLLAIWVNRGLLRLFLQRGRLKLLVAGFLLLQFYYIYALVGLALGFVFFYLPVRTELAKL